MDLPLISISIESTKNPIKPSLRFLLSSATIHCLEHDDQEITKGVLSIHRTKTSSARDEPLASRLD